MSSTRFVCVRCAWQPPAELNLTEAREAIHDHLLEHELITTPPPEMTYEEAVLEVKHLAELLRLSERQITAVNILTRRSARRDPEA